MAQRRAKNQNVNLIPNHQKLGIALIYLRASGVPHIVGKLSTKDKTLFHISPQLEVLKKIMSFQSCRNHNFVNFRIPKLGVLRQNDI